MIEIENWWLLAIPLFFALGWLAARIEQRAVLRDRHQLPVAYFKGLNFLLNEQADKAVDAFVDVVRIEPDAIDLHFALGNLFRRRGETDRAIRVHQNLTERNDLPKSQREHALFELGQDFLKAGLIDRAEDVFNRLEGSEYANAALRHRLEIAQTVRDWPAAIELAEKLETDSRESHQRQIAHYHCELAGRALAAGGDKRFDEARRQIDAALTVDPTHPRAHLMRGQIEFADTDFEAAIAAWSRLREHSPAHLALVIESWIEAHKRLGRTAEGIASAERFLQASPSSDVFAAVARAKVDHVGTPMAVAWAEEQLHRTPSLLGLEKLLALKAGAGTVERRADTELMQKLIAAQAKRLSRYVCDHCGFKARQYFWQCAGCNRWDSYAPRRSEELDA